MKRRNKLLKILVIVTSLILCSCWDARNIDDMYLVFGIGIDLSESNETQYLISTVSPITDPEAEDNKIEISSVSNSLRSAQDNIQAKANRYISLTNTVVFILGEDVAKQGIKRHIDTLIRDPESRGTMGIIVTEGRAVDLMNLDLKFVNSLSLYLQDLLEKSYYTTSIPLTTVREFNNDLYTDGIEPTIPYLKYGNSKEEHIINSTAIFEKDKMIGLVTHDESAALALLKAKARNGFLTSKVPDRENDYVTLRTLGGNNKISTKIRDNKLIIDHYITINGSITEQTCNCPLDKKAISRVEKALSYNVKSMSEQLINKLQNEYKVDSIGYGKYVRAHHPDFFKTDHWNSQFEEAQINVIVKINVISIGSIN